MRPPTRRPGRYDSILFEVGQGTQGIRELETRIAVPKGGLSRYLEVLCREMDLLKLEDPVCGRRKRARYVFTDPFFSFYYRWFFRRRGPAAIRLERPGPGGIDVVAEGPGEIVAGEVRRSPEKMDLEIPGRLQQKLRLMEAIGGGYRQEVEERARQLGALLLDLNTISSVFDAAGPRASGVRAGT